VSFTRGCDINSEDESDFANAVKLAAESDAVVMVMGGKSGLTRDCTTGEFRDATDLGLPGMQEKLINVVLEVGKPVILVLVNGRPAAIPEITDKVNAILETWVPGEEGGRAVAETLFGKNNPGGKLPLSIPRSAGQIPVFYNHKPSGMHSNIYGDYFNEPAAPLFCFGHGLSYTTFTYSNLVIEQPVINAGETLRISLDIRNDGEMAGDEVVQLYLHDEFASIPRPVKELKGYIRVHLEPAEQRRITFHLDTKQLAYYDENLDLILEPGKFEIMIGSSSEDIRLSGSFTVKGKDSYLVKERVFNCPVTIA
jgi:beta-glucosidase